MTAQVQGAHGSSNGGNGHGVRSYGHSTPKRPRSKGHPYVPGMFDALIDRPILGPSRPRPEQIRGVTVEVAASGRSVVVAEQLCSGAGPRHLLTLEEPHSVFMRLPDGREVWVEVRMIEQVPEEDREPWSEEDETPNPQLVTSNSQPSAFSCPDFLPH